MASGFQSLCGIRLLLNLTRTRVIHSTYANLKRRNSDLYICDVNAYEKRQKISNTVYIDSKVFQYIEAFPDESFGQVLRVVSRVKNPRL